MKNYLILILVFISYINQISGQDLTPTEEECVLELIVSDSNKIAEEEATVIITSTDGKINKTAVSNMDGICKFLIPEGMAYHIEVKKFGITFPFDLNINQYDGGVELSQRLIIKLYNTFVRAYTLDHIQFKTGSFDLDPSSYPTLDRLVNSMKKNTKIKIEVGGHTDNIGSEESNHLLSQQRADAIKRYIISKGIDGERVLTKGYGERYPIATNNTHEGRAKNRRTEVRIIEE